ncbi:transcriptional regulation of mitochondrial recombination-domain-containing protein [Dactylonectria estremocensis]|uniref:Large ribosomal subunit protein mL67 n=1 Tax=Dactylonectria estremocensis TaxID=1079267 RepID=A0A9P9FE56_9HYPO|nr:transcriptional regulation of mitochondrial recombination-domain-containing protein [Dactylonectria estremocensis]
MNATPASRLGQFPGLMRICVRHAHTGSKGKAKGFPVPKGHGENIWVFTHRRSDQIIYSFEPQLSGFHGLKQLPFNGKKTKPAKLRKDYWSPIAQISLPTGQGSIGRSVFQKLRELKHLHEVAWDDEFRYKPLEEYTPADKKRIAEEEKKGNPGYRPIRTKQERGIALNRQKPNAVADMAAVLSGVGRGNKIVTSESADGIEQQLMEVTVNWANDQDREYAYEWSDNVTHGLFEKPSYVSEEPVEEKAVEAKTA